MSAQFDAREIFRSLATHDVAYVTIGGIAVQAHGGQRLTRDLDVVIAEEMQARAHRVPMGDVEVPIADRKDLVTLK